MSLCLIILFNHPFPQNLPILRKIYASRFSHIVFLMPFYRGNESDVIRVYGHPYTFQDYLVQAYPHFKGNYSHYFVIGDDLLLNPILSENNILNVLECDSHTSYIKSLTSVSPNDPWAQRHQYLEALTRPGICLAPFLPVSIDLKPHFDRHGLSMESETLHLRTYAKLGFWHFVSHFAPPRLASHSQRLSHHKKPLTSHMQYVVRSYSDFVAIAAKSMDSFIHYCGVLSTIRLFAEMTIPTALIYAGARIQQEQDISYYGVETWTREANLTRAFTAAPGILDLLSYFSSHPKAIYVHPVKLSGFSSIL